MCHHIKCQKLKRDFREKFGLGGNCAWLFSFWGETCDQKFHVMLKGLVPSAGRFSAVYWLLLQHQYQQLLSVAFSPLFLQVIRSFPFIWITTVTCQCPAAPVQCSWWHVLSWSKLRRTQVTFPAVPPRSAVSHVSKHYISLLIKTEFLYCDHCFSSWTPSTFS